MAFHGDCSSYPLPDLLQWLDASRKTGFLTLEWGRSQRGLALREGHVVSTSHQGLAERVARVLDAGDAYRGGDVLAVMSGAMAPTVPLQRAISELTEEDLLASLVDLQGISGVQFHWADAGDVDETRGVAVALSARHLVFEVLRRLDEQAEVDRTLGADGTVLRAVEGEELASVLHRIVFRLVAAEGSLPMGRLCLKLGVHRGMVARAVYDLLRMERLAFDGSDAMAGDPVADMLEQGAALLRAHQLDAAHLVFLTLLQSNPGDKRVRDFARLVERELTAELYREIAPTQVFDVAAGAESLTHLRAEDRVLVAHAQSGIDVSSMVLASRQRELDTMKTLQRLVRQGVLLMRDAL